ncbi:MAG: hypothetical protein HY913_18620 [Desulfomonile tiedjei]|nr:hypothetical protein [Desulfomonile tiedjei]
MKSKTMLLAFAAVFALVFYSVALMDTPQAWAKSAGGQSSTSSRVVAPPPVNTGGSQSADAQAKKKKKTSGDQQEYMLYKMNEVLISN